MLRIGCVILDSKLKTVYVCQECGYKSSKWMGKCPKGMEKIEEIQIAAVGNIDEALDEVLN